jgi:DNA-binding transcriptional regulator YiaG
MAEFNDLANRQPPAMLPAPRIRKKLRETFKVTQLELARALGVSRQTVIAWEGGAQEPGGEARERYAELLRTWQSRAKAQKGSGRD